MRRDTVIQMLALALMLGFLGSAGFVATAVASSAGRNRLVYADAAEEGDPPEVALGIAMGAFRGMFVNWLWIRANDLKEQGKYHEAVDLSRTITRLQPRFPRVWSFHAWNLAYNISVATNTPQERWNWVKAGINLIRKEGIPANPGAIELYREVAWIHLHKIQAFMDDAHNYYKRQFAYDWTIALGAPPKFPKEIKTPAERAQYYNEHWLAPIAAAPDSLEELYSQRPGAKALVDRLRKEANVGPDKNLLEAIEFTRALNRMARGIGNTEPVNLPGPLGEIIADPSTLEDGQALVRTIRKVMLREEYSMDVERMMRYTSKYGPLDWRHASAHAVYWSAMGSEEALLRMNNENKVDTDIVNNDRVTVQALQDLFRTGTVYFDILNPNFYRQVPNIDFVDGYGKTMKEGYERSKFDSASRAYSFYAAGYENFLRDAIRYLWRRGDKELAKKYYQELRTDVNLNMNNPVRRQQLTLPIEEFVVIEIKEGDRTTSPVVALQEIQGAFVSAFTDGLLAGDAQAFESNMEYAKTFHKVFQDSQNFTTFISGQSGAGGRLGFPPFNYMAAQALAGMAEEGGIPDGAMMYRAAPEELRGRAYVFLERTVMRQQLDAAAAEGQQRPFNFWFPAPSDQALARYRQEMEAATRAISRDDAGNVEEK